MNRKQKCVREVTMAKLFTSELSQKVTYDCMQIFGGFGYTTEYPIGRIVARRSPEHHRRGNVGDHERDPRQSWTRSDVAHARVNQ